MLLLFLWRLDRLESHELGRPSNHGKTARNLLRRVVSFRLEMTMTQVSGSNCSHARGEEGRSGSDQLGRAHDGAQTRCISLASFPSMGVWGWSVEKLEEKRRTN